MWTNQLQQVIGVSRIVKKSLKWKCYKSRERREIMALMELMGGTGRSKQKV
jgi:predicted Fe-S protein YdhL (DUF1289 family)